MMNLIVVTRDARPSTTQIWDDGHTVSQAIAWITDVAYRAARDAERCHMPCYLAAVAIVYNDVTHESLHFDIHYDAKGAAVCTRRRGELPADEQHAEPADDGRPDECNVCGEVESAATGPFTSGTFENADPENGPSANDIYEASICARCSKLTTDEMLARMRDRSGFDR
jgi:hypothetical protein